MDQKFMQQVTCQSEENICTMGYTVLQVLTSHGYSPDQISTGSQV